MNIISMTNQPSVSIIIPCKSLDEYTKDCINRCRNLDYEKFEIIVLPDEMSENVEGIKIIPTNPVTPGVKRNIGIANSVGEICAFTDSDAYPREDWLKNAVEFLKDPDVAAVGGPGLTPDEDSLMQKASGLVLSSLMVGNLSKRYKSKNVLESDDIHSCNFIARKSVLVEIGGWNEKYWPGEDTLICRAIRKISKKKLIESPDVLVYHHRRPLFWKHLKQVSSYGLHRGFFARKFKDNSIRSLYFAPSLFIAFLLTGGALSFINYIILNIFLLSLAGYLLFCLATSLFEIKTLRLVPAVWLGIISTHIFYGTSFIVGFSKGDIKR